MNHLPTFEQFLNESNEDFVSEGVNYTSDKFALVSIGGSLATERDIPIFVSGRFGTIVETGNDKDVLKEKASRLRKGLSSGERKHYGYDYKVIELTPAKVKSINASIASMKESEKDEEE